MSTRTRLSFDVKIDQHGRTVHLAIADPSDISADNLALSTWGSSEILANCLHQIDVDLRHTGGATDVLPVLELGAGTGLVGMTAAVVWKTTVVLTDLPPILRNIEANVALNQQLIAEHGGKAAFGMLDWSDPARLRFGRPDASAAAPSASEPALCGVLEGDHTSTARVILAADTVYSEEHPELLVHAIGHRLEPGPNSRLVICYPLRIGYLDHIRDLWQRLEDGGFVCVFEGREHLDKTWEEDVEYEWCVWKWRDAGSS